MVTYKYTSKGFTLLETLIVFLLLAVLLGISGSLFVVSLRAWDVGQLRAGIRQDIQFAIEKIIRDLKQMANGSLSQYGSIAHTIQFSEISADTFVFYLYNANDSSLDSNYTESTYDLRKANITQGDNPSSGEGVLILRDVVSPDASAPATALSINAGSTEVTLDIVVQREIETVRVKTKVRPRNL
jgi:type II secretory pathway pseudopilin PulG